jgi:hypothetical protein
MLKAWQTWGDRRCLDSALAGGRFILRSQNPEGGWSLHYTHAMKPTWGRGQPDASGRHSSSTTFEPPSNHAAMTAEIVKTLLLLYLETGNAEYFDSARRAAAWLRTVQLEGEQWAEQYEFGSNLPLFVRTKRPRLVFTHKASERLDPEADLYHSPKEDPAIYLFRPELFPATQTYKDIPRSLAWCDYIVAHGRDEVLRRSQHPSVSDITARLAELRPLVEEIAAGQGADGRWLNAAGAKAPPDARRYDCGYDHPRTFEIIAGQKTQTRLSSGVFETNVRILSEYLGLRVRLARMTGE